MHHICVYLIKLQLQRISSMTCLLVFFSPNGSLGQIPALPLCVSSDIYPQVSCVLKLLQSSDLSFMERKINGTSIYVRYRRLLYSPNKK